MKTKHKIIAFVILLLLSVGTYLLLENYDLKEDAYTYLLVSFLIFDLLFGCMLVFGKIKWPRKKHRNYDYLRSHYL